MSSVRQFRSRGTDAGRSLERALLIRKVKDRNQATPSGHFQLPLQKHWLGANTTGFEIEQFRVRAAPGRQSWGGQLEIACKFALGNLLVDL
jgi:hypothetical protein